MCIFRDCKDVTTDTCNANHFFRRHLPSFLGRRDGPAEMQNWAQLFIRILNHLRISTIDDLYDRVVSRGWFPAKRSLEDIQQSGRGISRHDTNIVDAFAQYIGVPRPIDYSETHPQSPALLINWRVLRCILHYGFTDEDREKVVRFSRPSGKSKIPIPRRY